MNKDTLNRPVCANAPRVNWQNAAYACASTGVPMEDAILILRAQYQVESEDLGVEEQ